MTMIESLNEEIRLLKNRILELEIEVVKKNEAVLRIQTKLEIREKRISELENGIDFLTGPFD